MTKRISLNTGSIVVAIAIALFLIAGSEQVVAQTQCPGGTVAITDATRSLATLVGLPTSVQCWNPNDPNTGTAAGEAKQFIQQHAVHGANISCLNSQFATQLTKMMQAIPANLGTVLIDSGYRSPQEQAALPSSATKVGACGSYHNYGLAADFNYSSKQVVQWIRANASQFGLTVIGDPTTGCFSSGFCDPAHVQEKGSLPPSNQCGICNSNVGGSQPAPPNAAPFPSEGNFYTPPTTGAQIPAGYCLVSAQPLIYTPCNSTNPTQQLTPAAPPAQPAPATTQPIQQTAATTPTVTPTSPLSVPTTSPASVFSNLLQPAPFTLPPTATSAIQALNIITNLGSFTTSATTSLNQSLDNIINNLIPGNATTTVQASTSNTQLVPPQDTFTSNSMQYTPTYSPEIDQILGSIKNVLLDMLSYLRSL